MSINRYGVAGLLMLGMAAGLAGCSGGGTTAAAGVELNNEDEKTLYALGLSMGGSLVPYDLKPEEIAIVEAGLEDAATGATARVDIQVYGLRIRDFMQKRTAAKAATEKESARAFVEQLAKADGAESTSSGLVYVEVKRGSGALPQPTDKVKVHYRGTLIDGTEFDSSYERGEPVEFLLSQVIPCWIEGVQKMAVGGKAKLACPSDIAYGDSGRPPSIPPGATLIFEIELLGIGS